MSNQTPFQEMGRTYAFVANGASGTLIITADSPPQQYRIWNSGNTTVFMNVGSAGGNTSAAVPAVGSPAYGFPLPAGFDGAITAWQGQGSNVTMAFISTGANIVSTVYITPGEGFRG